MCALVNRKSMLGLLAWRKRVDRTQEKKGLLPGTPVSTMIPSQYFGDAIMIQDIISLYTAILDGKKKFPNGIHIELLERALLRRELAGPLSDILQMLLGSIFSFETGEHTKIYCEYQRGRISFKDATTAASWSDKHINAYLFELPMDANTLSELLRLYLLMMKSKLSEAVQRSEHGDYQSQDDSRLHDLHERHPHILKALATKTVYELPTRDIMIILKSLIDQLMSYSSMRELIQERMQKSEKSKISIKSLIAAERKRKTQVEQRTNRALEEIKKSLDTFKGTNEEKAAYKERQERETKTMIQNIEVI